MGYFTLIQQNRGTFQKVLKVNHAKNILHKNIEMENTIFQELICLR